MASCNPPPVDKFRRPPERMGIDACLSDQKRRRNRRAVGKSRSVHGRATGQGPRAAELCRVSLLDQGGPPTACRARWRPWAAAAPCLRHRSGGPHPLSAQPCQGGRPDQEATRPLRAPGPGRRPPSVTRPPNRTPLDAAWPTEPQPEPRGQATSATSRSDRGEARDDGRSVAEDGTGLLETHVTGAQSAHPPSWLTFAGSAQNPLQLDIVKPGLQPHPRSSTPTAPVPSAPGS